ncbi:hypothetical protein GH714_036365 [Hevea brasiliensis]|uniref:Uncharacterized protein n=1 Tax=Hevea brasiliensis TaxID=3981 RepID=A0A6A6LT48_HEVBR|nr:hypothetical protein GH714_036365 [Hevea brasiliensis]
METETYEEFGLGFDSALRKKQLCAKSGPGEPRVYASGVVVGWALAVRGPWRLRAYEEFGALPGQDILFRLSVSEPRNVPGVSGSIPPCVKNSSALRVGLETQSLRKWSHGGLGPGRARPMETESL